MYSSYFYYGRDVPSSQCNHLSGNMAEGKPYFFEKHKLNGYKAIISPLQLVLSIGCTTRFPGSVFDFEHFFKTKTFTQKSLEDLHERLIFRKLVY